MNQSKIRFSSFTPGPNPREAADKGVGAEKLGIDKDFMLSKVQKYIDSLSSIPHLEALQEASQLFEKEREPWK